MYCDSDWKIFENNCFWVVRRGLCRDQDGSAYYIQQHSTLRCWKQKLNSYPLGIIETHYIIAEYLMNFN